MADNVSPAAAADVLAAATEALQAGRPLFAAQFAEAALAVKPDDPQALQILLAAHRAAGALTQAEAAARRCLALNPADLWAVIELAHVLRDAGRLAEAEHYARHAVRAAPRAGTAHNVLGLVLTDAQRPIAAEHHYRRVLALGGQRDPAVLANLAWNLKTQGRMAEARATYRNAVTIAPGLVQAWLGWARLETVDRDFASAEQKLGQAERLAPNDPAVLHARAALLAGTGRPQDALALYQRLGQFSRAACLEKGRLLDSLGEYDAAWAAWTTAPNPPPPGAEAAAASYANLRAAFSAEQMEILPRAAPRPELPTPIFLLGAARAGTALLEQMLAGLPGLAAGGALPGLTDLAARAPALLGSPYPYPLALSEMFMGDQTHGIDVLRDFYLQRAAHSGSLRPDARKFTDRHPLNIAHLGLITLMFGQAPMIQLQRHPLDVLVSQIAQGNAANLDDAARQLALADDHLAQTQALAEKRLLRLSYEDLVTEPEKTLRRACAHIGEAFDAACLRFDSRQRYTHASTEAQLNQPLHPHSLGRYGHYARHLQPVLGTLAPALARLGYTA